jgi:uncharacterized membrane protein
MRLLLLAAVATWVAGIALIAWSILEKSASVALLVIFPVVSGSSASFLLGVALLIGGFLLLPLALAYDGVEPAPSLGSTDTELPAPRSAGSAGGFVLVGPVPIVFGSWKGVSRRTRWLLALAGTVLLIVALVAFVLIVG